MVFRTMLNHSPKTTLIKKIMTERFNPVALVVSCESQNHNVPPGTEKHFFVGIVSDKFTGMRLVERHRNVSQPLMQNSELAIHALRIWAKTPTEIPDLSEPFAEAPGAPKCAGGNA